jgi:two-component system, NtrC family, sensor kinase
MTTVYYYLVLLNAVVSLAVAIAVWWKNRYQSVGPLLGITMLIMAAWCAAFAQYFRRLEPNQALFWAQLTLTAAILNYPFYFHGLCALLENQRRFRWWIAASYVTGALFVVLLWSGQLVAGLKGAIYMDHYVRYNRAWYPFFGMYLVFWQWFGAGLLVYFAAKAAGYKRTQLIYFIAAWLVIFLCLNSIILPLEYNINIQPFGFFVLPANLVLLAYVMGKARLADYNVVIARGFLYAVTMVVVAGATLIFLGGMAMVAPRFMNQQQLTFAFMLSMSIGFGLTISLPRLLPRAERMMQERMFGQRYGYQDALASLVKDLSRMPTIDQVLAAVASTVHTQMQLSRVLIFMQDPLAGTYELQAESGLGLQDGTEALTLKEDGAIVKWLVGNRDALVRDEMARRVAPWLQQQLSGELNQLNVNVCVPMIVDDRLTGLIGLGEKLSQDMFFVSDLRILETLATEVALAVKYRRMEDEVFRKNRLAELGTIAAGVAHEIRNPLASIKTFAQLMPERMDDPEFKTEFSKLVQKDVDRITKVIESMLAFARPAQVTIGEHAANDLAEEAILLVQPRLKDKRIELTRQFHGNPRINVDKHQVLQVLVNLLSNAADALHEKGKIRVATGVRQLDIGEDGNKNRDYAVIEVADNGPGIPAAVRSRLFDPFFTTKKGGTGLGLSISQKIVRDHGGAISVTSVEGKGTSFQVNLPLK